MISDSSRHRPNPFDIPTETSLSATTLSSQTVPLSLANASRFRLGLRSRCTRAQLSSRNNSNQVVATFVRFHSRTLSTLREIETSAQRSVEDLDYIGLQV